jgi:Copper type II ascorbate-dependent monooxygenase, C-terminal domain
MRTKRAILLGLYLCLVTGPSALLSRCLLAAPRSPVGESSGGDKAVPSYCKDVAPILQKHCLDCHRKGQVAPFSLETYEQARKRASDISSVVEDRVMPPWKAVPHFGLTLRGDRSLSSAEIAIITQWADADAPEGNPADLPPPRQFPDGWSLGTPDLVLDTGTDFAVPASGEDVYRCFVVPTDLPDDVYVSGIIYRPGNRRVVHHILSYVDTSGEGKKKDALDAAPGYPCFSGPGVDSIGDMGGWVPGIEPTRLPDGFGKALPRKADIIVQIHYHPSGKPETDRTQVGLYFAKKPVKRTLQRAGAWNPELVLPTDGPNPSHIEARASWTIPVDIVAFACAPHMHLLGRDMQISVRFPDGHRQDLLKVDDWDFNWQFAYRFLAPMILPKGTVLEVVAHYDNTADNPRNLNKPPKVVRWGEATTDEMCIGFIMIAKKDQDLTKPGEKDDLFKIIKQSGGWPILSDKPSSKR